MQKCLQTDCFQIVHILPHSQGDRCNQLQMHFGHSLNSVVLHNYAIDIYSYVLHKQMTAGYFHIKPELMDNTSLLLFENML